MAATPQNQAAVECRTPEGRLVAILEIVAPANSESYRGNDHPLVLVPPTEAHLHGEETVQLRERARYEYRLKPVSGEEEQLALLPQRGIQPSRVSVSRADDERGLIEPGDHCGALPLVVVRRGDVGQRPLARGTVEVRSVKLGYRDHYRGMLSFIADKCAGLVLDSRSATRLRLDTLWAKDSRLLEQQLEFLRHTLEGATFRAAVDEILRNPHRRLEDEHEERDLSRPFKPDGKFARQVAVATHRTRVPRTHPLHDLLPSLPARVTVRRRIDFLDTAENRFAKMVLTEFRDFLSAVTAQLTQSPGSAEKPDNLRLLREAGRLRGMLETQLARGFLPDVSPPTMLPVGSPVIQRKSGYRELLRFWLQFHAGAQLVWHGGYDVYAAGARNVATLYEYWLFFQLETLFRQKFACSQALHELLIEVDDGLPRLKLRRGVELKAPVTGASSESAGRRLHAEFHFNRRFAHTNEPMKAGTWSRGAQPDYTISIWPADFSAAEAEAKELMVHVHFDAKYRVERVQEVLGSDDDDSAFVKKPDNAAPPRTMAKYDDLLKMHAYRDAIRRTAGAYVIYPGNPNDGRQFKGFHEILPGLGAFAVRPSVEGSAEGIAAVSTFLDEVIDHLANRTTARERVSFHVEEAYQMKDEAVPHRPMRLPESDVYGKAYRALPPAEHMVLVAWYRTPNQLALARSENGFTFVRLGRRQGAFHIHPNLARVRHVLLRTEDSDVAVGLLELREPGLRVFTRRQLRAELAQHAQGSGVAVWQEVAGSDDEEFLYALFKTRSDTMWEGVRWHGQRLMNLIEKFESDVRNKLVENVGRTSPYPRILDLRDLLNARVDGERG